MPPARRNKPFTLAETEGPYAIWLCPVCRSRNLALHSRCFTCTCRRDSTLQERKALRAEQRRIKTYVCRKCRHRQADRGEIRAGGLLFALAKRDSGRYSYLACRRCGYAEFYRHPLAPRFKIADLFG